MNMEFGLLTSITLLGAAQGLFLALALLNTRRGDVQAHRILALMTFLFALDLGEEFLYQVGFFQAVPHLLHVLAPIDLLYAPLIYLYVVQLTSPAVRPQGLGLYGHFIPAVTAVILLLPFFLLDGSIKWELSESLRTGETMTDPVPQANLIQTGLSVFIVGTITQMGLYLAWSIRRLLQHARDIKNKFSDIDRINLNWLRNLLIGLGTIFALYLADQFFPNLLGMNILGDLITILVVILIYAMGYLGLRQPAIFTQVTESTQKAEELSADNDHEKYQRSGLDRETSHAFLSELTRHMEEQKPYLEGDLVLPQLADQLGISPNYLSQIINEQLNVNFYDFVNGYRVEEAKQRIRVAKKSPNILGIALDSGFNSKSAFYTAFKKVTSMTPTQYRKSLQGPTM